VRGLNANRKSTAIVLVLLATLPLAGRTGADCPSNQLTSSTSAPVSWTTAVKETTIGYVDAFSRARSDWTRDSLYFYCASEFMPGAGTFDATERFTLVGPPAGTPATFSVYLQLNGRATANLSDFLVHAHASASLLVNGAVVDSAAVSVACGNYECIGGQNAFDSHPRLPATLAGTVSVIAGQEFPVSAHFAGSGDGNLPYASSVEIGAKLQFAGVPAGSAIVSCHGDTTLAVLAVGPRPLVGSHILSVGPNPARGPIAVTFETALGGRARVQLLDVAGRTLENWLPEVAGPGALRVTLNQGSHLAPGTYFVRFTQGDIADIRVVTVLR
jgi:hypothetical protein